MAPGIAVSLHQPPPWQCLRAVEVLASIASALLAAEFLAQRELIADDGLLSWKQHSHRHPRVTRLLARIHLTALFRSPGTAVWLAVIRLLCAVLAIILALQGHPSPTVLVVLCASTLLWHFRMRTVLDGSAQFSLLCLLAATVPECIGSASACLIALYFLAAQGALCYTTSGFLKLNAAAWHNGSAVLYVLSSSSFGHEKLLQFFRKRQKFTVMAGLLLVAGECSLSFAALLPPNVCIALLACGLLLHAVIAYVLGLNTYFWAFAACYPATYFVSSRIYKGH